MTEHSTAGTTALAAFTMTLLRCGERYLMLQRSLEKRFAPGLWSGVGGRIEPDEMDDIVSAASREITEETGIEASGIRSLTLRRSLVQQRPGYPVTVLLYFTGETDRRDLPPCREGTLHWLTAREIERVEVIENTALVLPMLIESMRRDPDGLEPMVTGAASFSQGGELLSIVWSR